MTGYQAEEELRAEILSLKCKVCHHHKQFINGECFICNSDLNRLQYDHLERMQQIVCVALMGGDWDAGFELREYLHGYRPMKDLA